MLVFLRWNLPPFWFFTWPSWWYLSFTDVSCKPQLRSFLPSFVCYLFSKWKVYFLYFSLFVSYCFLFLYMSVFYFPLRLPFGCLSPLFFLSIIYFLFLLLSHSLSVLSFSSRLSSTLSFCLSLIHFSFPFVFCSCACFCFSCPLFCIFYLSMSYLSFLFVFSTLFNYLVLIRTLNYYNFFLFFFFKSLIIFPHYPLLFFY